MEILIIKLSAIGDVIHTLPALELLRCHFPDSRITWVVEERASGILYGHPLITRLIVSNRKRWLSDLGIPSRWYGLYKEVRHFLAEFRAVHYDLVIDFQGLFKSALLVLLSRGRHKVGYDRTRELSYLVLNHRIAAPSPDEHAVSRNVALVHAVCQSPWAADDRCFQPSRSAALRTEEDRHHPASPPTVGHAAPSAVIALSEMDTQNVEHLLQDAGLDGKKPLIVVNAPAGWESKRWGMSRTAALADLLIERYGARIVYTGATHDDAYIRDILSYMKNPALNAAGRTSLKELACLMKRADLLITTDSGPMHLAATLGTPIVALFGPTAPWRTGPYAAPAEIVNKQLPCAPCFKKKCSSMVCMNGIEVGDVIHAVEKLMEKTK